MRWKFLVADRSRRETALIRLVWICLLAAGGLAGLVAGYGSLAHYEPFGLAAANRTLNQLTAVLLTCVALVVPLTSNLYSPKLVKLYVTHPLIVIGLGILVLSHLLVLTGAYFPPGGWVSDILMVAVSLCCLIVLSATLPYLYGISQFLRPSYFLPMLTRRGVRSLRLLQRQRSDDDESEYDLFGMIDVITNIAMTGMARGDRQLVLLALRSLQVLLHEVIDDGALLDRPWRGRRPCFVPGLAREGQDYLARERIWPEAYVLAQMLKVMEVASRRQHEILGELSSQLVASALRAFALRRLAIVELHVMAFNTLLREAIDEKDLRRFQNVSYHYRLLAEGLHSDPARMAGAAHHLMHYGRMAGKQGPFYGLETVLFDTGELLLSIARLHQPAALVLWRQGARDFIGEHCDAVSPQSRVAWRVLIRLYWECRALRLDDLASDIAAGYLGDQDRHKQQVLRALAENRELHFEFNDRLMRFAHLSPVAEAQARVFAYA